MGQHLRTDAASHRLIAGCLRHRRADDLPAVTILFADLVNFTPRVAALPASQVVTILNRIFSEFDALADRHGLEKIKIIGDAYMVAGGIPVPQLGHASLIAEMALDMMDVMRGLSREFDDQFSLRIGIDSGPTVAGVIGSRKPFYDVWGDTVNTAARMESQGVPGLIQVTSRAKKAIGRQYIFECRGLLDVKGKGKMRVYFLKGRRTFIQRPDQ